MRFFCLFPRERRGGEGERERERERERESFVFSFYLATREERGARFSGLPKVPEDDGRTLASPARGAREEEKTEVKKREQRLVESPERRPLAKRK